VQYRLRLAVPLVLLALPACIIVVDEEPDDPPADTSEVVVTSSCSGEPSSVDTAGGCGSTQTWACWDGTFLESFPVQVPIAIHHAPAGDCDAYLTDTISVRLDPVIDGYIDAYGGTDPIMLRVGDFSPVWQP
jgi:hypothetical protein